MVLLALVCVYLLTSFKLWIVPAYDRYCTHYATLLYIESSSNKDVLISMGAAVVAHPY